MAAVTSGAGGKTVEKDEVESEVAVIEAPPDRPTQVLPTDGFHDSREAAAASAAGKPDQSGYPLHPTAVARIAGLEQAAAGIKSWVSWIENEIAAVKRIGAGS